MSGTCAIDAWCVGTKGFNKDCTLYIPPMEGRVTALLPVGVRVRHELMWWGIPPHVLGHPSHVLGHPSHVLGHPSHVLGHPSLCWGIPPCVGASLSCGACSHR